MPLLRRWSAEWLDAEFTDHMLFCQRFYNEFTPEREAMAIRDMLLSSLAREHSNITSRRIYIKRIYLAYKKAYRQWVGVNSA